MNFFEDAKYCATVVHTAQKYNKYGINVAEEYDYITRLEDEIKYNVTKSETEELVLTNRIFFLRHLIIMICREELAINENIELFKIIEVLFKTLGELIIRCNNADPERYKYMDSLLFTKKQVELMINNVKGNQKIIYMLMYAEIEYIIRKYCKKDFIEMTGAVIT